MTRPSQHFRFSGTFNDAGMRLLMAPLLGIAIGSFSGVYEGLHPASPLFWAATGFLTLLSFVTWEGNRRFWAHLKRKPNWLDRPVRRAVLLAAVHFGWTAFASITLLIVWQRIAMQDGPDWRVIQTLTLTSIVCVAFLAHAYETAHLVRQRRRDREAKLSLELAALNAQVDPHFVYNSLNTIVELNDEDPASASQFALSLAEVYRYVVLNSKRDTVALAQELEFVSAYVSLLRTRFGECIQLSVPHPAPQFSDLRLPPVALQVLVENAVKHNRFSDAEPLQISIELAGRGIVVSNELRPLTRPRPGSRTGLVNLDQRCKLICGAGIQVEETTHFRVRVPFC